MISFKKKQSVLTNIMSSFEGENMQAQYNALRRRMDVYFHDYKFATETDENEHINRSIDYYIKRQKARKQELGCKFMRVDSDKEDFDIFTTINEIFRNIKKSTKETLIKKV